MTDKRFENITSISCNGGLILCSFVYDRPKHYVLSREGAKQRTTMKPVKLLNRKTAVGSSYGVQITKDTANVQCLQTHFTQFDDFHTILYCLLYNNIKYTKYFSKVVFLFSSFICSTV